MSANENTKATGAVGLALIWARWTSGWERFFILRTSNEVAGLVLAALFASLTGLLAQVRLYTPWSPVPITLQVLGVLLSAGFLGRFWGPASQIVYIALGAAGVPWFAPSANAGAFTNGGLKVLLGATGGYLFAFPLAAATVGALTDRYVQARSVLPQLLIQMFGVGIIYAGGVVGLELVLHWPAEKLLVQGVLLFIPFDLAKSVFAAVLTTSAAPKKALGNEKDRGRPYARWWPAGAPPR